MSVQITTAFVNQYNSNVIHLSQQKQSLLQGLVRGEGIAAEKEFFDRINKTAAVKKTVRHGDTPLVHSEHSRRMVTSFPYEWADLVDKEDKIRTLISPQSEYVKAAVYAMNRSKDEAILAAAIGSAWSGKEGTTEVVFDVANQEVGEDIGASDSNLNLAKLLAAKEILGLGDVDKEEPRYICVSPKMLTALLNTTEIKSIDYNTVKALVKGEINTFCGFTFIETNLLPANLTADGKFAIAWAREGLLLATGADISTRVTERADKSYAVQVYASQDIGATRMEDVKVIRIDCIGG